MREKKEGWKEDFAVHQWEEVERKEWESVGVKRTR